MLTDLPTDFGGMLAKLCLMFTCSSGGFTGRGWGAKGAIASPHQLAAGRKKSQCRHFIFCTLNAQFYVLWQYQSA